MLHHSPSIYDYRQSIAMYSPISEVIASKIGFKMFHYDLATFI